MTTDQSQPAEDLLRPRLKEGDEGYDEFRQEQPTEELSEEGLERIFKMEEMRAKVQGEEMAEIEEEILTEMEADPYLGWALQKYRSLGPVKMGMLQKAAGKQPFNGVQVAAFTKMITRLDFASIDEDTLFNMAFLKMVSASMTSDQRVHFMTKVPEDAQAQVVGTMRKLGMVTEEEVEKYAAKMSEGYSDPTGVRQLYLADVQQVMADIDATIRALDADQKTYSYKRVVHPRNEMERKYTIQNALMFGGLGVGIMTFLINSGGALRKLIVKGDPAGAWEHIANHPYVPLSALAITLSGRALSQMDRPLIEAVVPGKRARLGELINDGVSRSAIVHLKNEDLFYAMQDDFESRTDYEEMRGKPLQEAMPKVYANLESRGLLPLPHEEADMVEDFINLYVSLRGWNYWSYGSYYKFATYCEKKYEKVRRAEALRLQDEQTDRSEAEVPEADAAVAPPSAT